MNKYAVALYDDEDVLKSGIGRLQSAGVQIYNVYTPYPVHGLEKLVGVRRSRLDIVAFCFGCLGVSCAFLLMWHMITYDWPMNIAGKPNFPFIRFILICFELTVSFSSYVLGLTFFLLNRFIAIFTPRILNIGVTHYRFC